MIRQFYVFILLCLVLASLPACKRSVVRYSSIAMEATIQQGEKVRVFQTRDFKRNDIAAFTRMENELIGTGYNEDGSTTRQLMQFMYRIIALSGDTLQIINNRVLINGKPAITPPGVQLLYTVYSTTLLEELTPPEQEGLQLTGLYEKVNDTFIYRATLTAEKAENLARKNPGVIRVEEYIKEPNADAEDGIARNHAGDRWNISNYGPLVIPRPGETIQVTPDNARLYQNIAGVQEGRFTIPEKLYFLMGDNRSASYDSRYFGFLPQSAMVGVARNIQDGR